MPPPPPLRMTLGCCVSIPATLLFSNTALARAQLAITALGALLLCTGGGFLRLKVATALISYGESCLLALSLGLAMDYGFTIATAGESVFPLLMAQLIRTFGAAGFPPFIAGLVGVMVLSYLALHWQYRHLLCATTFRRGAQEEDAIEELVNEFERFLRALDNGQAAPTPPLPPPDTKAVPVANEPWCVASLARDALSRLVASKDDEFYRKIHFPLYGCCLLVSAVEQVADAGEERAVSLLLLGLDKWEFRIHDTYTQLEQISHCKDSQLLSVGSISGSKMCDCVLRKFYELLEKSEKKTKTDRSATHGAGSGNQKTPAFILTLLRAALQDPSGAETFAGSPQGGFTDVGMHTGTRARGTVWPLARAYLRYILENLTGPSVQCAPLESAQVRLLLGLFHLHAAEEALRVSAPAVGSTSTYLAKHAVDETMGMLGAAARDAAGLCGEGYQSFFDWQDFERRKIHVKSELYGRAQQCRDVATYLFALPGAEPDASSAGRLVQIVLPLQGNTAADEALNLQQRRA
ncbi:hypothetical protein B484DRAFT_438466, partial [Ochromonadaceae sp. CCMP2298]